MSKIPGSTLADSERLIADLQRQLAERTAERDEASRRLDERTAERDEAQAQQTATAEVLGVINSSPGDLAPVFDAILEKAHALCGAASGSLQIYDGESIRAIATRGLPDRFANLLREPHRLSLRNSRIRSAFLQGVPYFQISDLSDTVLTEGYPTLAAAQEITGTRTLLNVPLRKDGELLGVIVAGRLEVRPFTDKEIALLQNFAAQAVIAMENARLLTETREALEQQTATAEVLQVINSSPGDLAPVFDAMLDKALRLCGAAQGALWLIDAERGRLAAAQGLAADFVELLRERGEIGLTPPLQRVMRGERVIHYLDTKETELPFVEAAVAADVRTLLWVALVREGTPLGAFAIARREVRAFSDKEIALLQNFAAQAVIAMENARLIAETREALEQQTATAEVLAVINASSGDLTPVFEAILEKAHSLCGVAFGFLQLYDSGKLRAVALRGVPDSVAAVLRQPIEPTPGLPPARLIDGERIVQEADMAALVADGRGGPRAEAIIENGVRTALFVPLRKDANFLGCIAAFRKEVQPFSNNEIALLENFASQAVIAIENARLITETREALDQQTATAEVLGVINSSPGDLAPVFDAMLERAMRLCEADYGHILTFDGQRFHPAAIRGEAGFVEWRRRVGPVQPDSGADASPLGRVMQGERVAQVADATHEKAYHTLSSYRELVDISGIRSQAAVALRKEDVLLGAIVVYRREVRPFSDKEIGLLQNFAAQAVIAMENARLLGELRQRTDEVGELNRDLEARVAEQVDELGRVGRLKRFLAPQLAELIVSQGDEKILESHRREIVVVFCDLRGYTAFTETVEPEEVLDFLREYHGALGPLVSQFEGTLDQFSGDGIMVFFNDPVPCADPAERAVNMAIAMREAAGKLIVTWRRDGCELGFGAGIAQGYATLGQIGFSERSGYTAIGTVCNLAARLCAEAKDGQILISSRVARAVEAVARLEDLGNLELKGLRRPVAAFNVVQSTSSTEARPNLTVVAKGPGV